MSFESLNAAKLTQDKPLDTDLMLQIKDNFDALNGSITSLFAADIPNGSFEVDSDANGVPDNWTVTTYPGGTVSRETTNVAHGAASIKMVHPGGAGNGGGYAVSDYIACSEISSVIVSMFHWSTATGMSNSVTLFWYTAAKVACAVPSTVIFSSTSNPTTPVRLTTGASPPSTARFFKLVLIGGESSVDVAGTAYYDGLSLSSMNTDQVLLATSGAAVDAVGTYAFLFNSAATVLGSNYAGSGLRFAAATTTTQVVSLASPAPSGTWKAMGSSDGTTNNATTFLRVA